MAAASAATFDAFRDFYNGLLDAIARLGLTRADFGGLLDVSMDNFLVPPGPFFDGEGVIKDLPCCLPTLDGIWSAVLPAVDMAAGNITLASLDTSLRALHWARALEMSLAELDVAPADYSPPRYIGADGEPSSMEAEVEAHDVMADTFVARTATSLDSFDSYNQYVDSGAGSNASQAANTSLLLDNLPSFDFSFNFKVGQSAHVFLFACLLSLLSIPCSIHLTHNPTRDDNSTRRWRAPTSTSMRSSTSSTPSPTSPSSRTTPTASMGAFASSGSSERRPRSSSPSSTCAPGVSSPPRSASTSGRPPTPGGSWPTCSRRGTCPTC